MCVAARDAGFKEFYAPAEDAMEAAAVEGITVYAVENMRQLVCHLNGTEPLTPVNYDRNGFSDVTYYEYYKQAKKCCNYRVNGDFVFVNTTHGIICMEKCDITDRRSRRVKHTRRRRGKNRAGNTTYVMHTHEYYTYHFDLYTEHGHFKNTVANNAVLEDLNKLFYGH